MNCTGGEATHASGVPGRGGVFYGGENTAGTPNFMAAIHLFPRAVEPATGAMGDLYVKSGDGKLYIHNGSAFVVVGSQTT